MQIIDKDLLARIRSLPCAYCDRKPPSQVSHTFGRGTGGWQRLDHTLNVVPL